MAGELGFEPRLTESESAVLPLNYSPICACAARCFSQNDVKRFLRPQRTRRCAWRLDLGQFGRLSKSRMMRPKRGEIRRRGGPAHQDRVAGSAALVASSLLWVVSNTTQFYFIPGVIEYLLHKYMYLFSIDSPLYMAVVYCQCRFTYAFCVGDYSMSVDIFADRLARVRGRFVSTLQARIDGTDAAVPKLGGSTAAAAAAVGEAYRCMHGIVGVGPTVGFPATGRAAHDVEDVLRPAQNERRGLSDNEIAALRERLFSLRAAAEREMQHFYRGLKVTQD